MSPTSSLTDPGSIVLNRQGEITPQQREALLRVTSGYGWLGCGVAAIVMVGIILVTGDWLGEHEVVGIVVLLAVLILSVLVTGWVTSLPMRQRLKNARAQELRGEVVWRKSNYVAVADGCTLKPVFTTPTLPPGQYTFFCLENSKWLLSAELLQNAGSRASVINTDLGGFGDNKDAVVGVPVSGANFTVNELRHALASTGEFHPDALEANRDGRMSSVQRMGKLKDSLGTLIFAIAILGLAGFLFYSAKQKEQSLGDIALVMGFFGVIGLITLFSTYKNLADALVGRVEIVTGKGTRTIRYSRGRNSRRTYYCVVINEMSFDIPHAAYNALVEGVVYRAYYTPRTRDLMNIEPDA
jgi:hypothetical protein